ncbi:RadC family protein [Fusibacter ferrireducens]|uniref:DNA repair protein RadC n=1 Tax=Fusibacter ferrireducens TaxID=2785058 RepID=A0ABR9ZZ45_9FIRM|nr:DNA repair protein RadC [Fusibacter ferrireducens]MBF4694864.1 DNA repair protein RadC [Fusibacter ferrireducens]
MIKKLPLEERPREKMMMYGEQALSNAELLAIILRTGTAKKSAIDVAHDLIEKCPADFSDLNQFSLEELCEIEGIGPSKACQILSSLELGRRIQRSSFKSKTKVTSPDAIFTFFKSEIGHEKVEKFIVVLLNTKNEMIKWEIISVGSLNASIVHPREVFNKAIKKNAAAIIAVHNHPSGHVTPSREDLNITMRLKEAGRIVGINLIDHIIIGHEKYYSFKENDQL